MNASRPAGVLASALSALVADDLDIADVLAHLMTDGAGVVGADAIALMARDTGGDVSLLAASSHRATEIELLQIQRLEGPCVDCIRSGERVALGGADRLVERWGAVGRGITDAGFASVEAYPMRWRGESLGGLNVFRSSAETPEPSELCQALVDVSTLVVVQAVAGPVSHEQVRARMHEALSARELVEQAKGVLAYAEHLDMEQAYTELLRRSAATRTPLTQLAQDVVRRRGASQE